MQTIEVLICTIDNGISDIADHLAPPQDGVRYLVSWQQSGAHVLAAPTALLQRSDVGLTTLPGRGLSANRNHALRHATGDLLVIADDDACYRSEYFATIRRAFAAWPAADIITFRIEGDDGRLLRSYPAAPYDYRHRPRGAYVCSLEIVCRRTEALPFFDERFGVGTAVLGSGEEEVFIHEAYRRGLQVHYVPEVIAMTGDVGRGAAFLTDAAVQRAKGGVLCVMHGVVGATLRCLREALRLPAGVPRWRMFRQMCAGIRYVWRTKAPQT